MILTFLQIALFSLTHLYRMITIILTKKDTIKQQKDIVKTINTGYFTFSNLFAFITLL